MDEATAAEPRSRRSPTHRRGRPVLSRDAIGRAVLELAARDGADAVTMRALAAHLRVTPKALYLKVADRDDALGAAAVLAQADWVVGELDPERWPDALRALCDGLRDWYLRYPALLRLAASADVTAEVPPQTLRNNERIFGFLRATGLSPADTVAGWRLIVTTVAGFTEVEQWETGSRRHARPEHADDEWAPTPRRLLDQHPDLDLTHTTEVMAHAAEPDGDVLFADTVGMLVAWVGARRGT